MIGLETDVSELFVNTPTRWRHNKRETVIIKSNFEFIVWPAIVCICKENTK